MNWTLEQKKAAAKLWNDGQSAAQIAPIFGKSRNAIIAIADRNRDLFRRVGPAGRAKSGGRVKSVWTDETISKAEKQWRDGLSISLIAMTAGVSEMAAKQMMARDRSRFPLRNVVRPGTGRLAGKPAAERVGKEKKIEARPLDVLPVWADVADVSSRLDLSQYRLAEHHPVAFSALGRMQCRFPLVAFDAESGPDMPCCGANTTAHASYCNAHRAVMGGRL